MFISWPTKRLLMAEVLNEHAEKAGGKATATLETALDSVQQGYEPYEGFPAEFVAAELKLLIQQHGPQFPAGDLLSQRDWRYRDLGREPVVVVLDPDIGDFLAQMVECNGFDQDGYANQLFENAVLAEVGIGEMLVKRQGGVEIAGHRVERGSKVQAEAVAGQCQRRRVTYRHPRHGVITGDLDAADLLKPEDAEQERQWLLQRVQQALAGLDVAVHPLSAEGEAVWGIVRVTTNSRDEATFTEAGGRLRKAGLNANIMRGVLHVRE